MVDYAFTMGKKKYTILQDHHQPIESPSAAKASPNFCHHCLYWLACVQRVPSALLTTLQDHKVICKMQHWAYDVEGAQNIASGGIISLPILILTDTETTTENRSLLNKTH